MIPVAIISFDQELSARGKVGMEKYNFERIQG
jgi:hypothetical protein